MEMSQAVLRRALRPTLMREATLRRNMFAADTTAKELWEAATRNLALSLGKIT